MGERKWTWRSWTVREKDAIIDKERGREVNITFGAGSIVLAGGEGIGLARRGFWEGREGGGGCKWRGDGWVRCLPDHIGGLPWFWRWWLYLGMRFLGLWGNLIPTFGSPLMPVSSQGFIGHWLLHRSVLSRKSLSLYGVGFEGKLTICKHPNFISGKLSIQTPLSVVKVLDVSTVRVLCDVNHKWLSGFCLLPRDSKPQGKARSHLRQDFHLNSSFHVFKIN